VTIELTNSADTPEHAELRRTVRTLCEQCGEKYWQQGDLNREYPEQLVDDCMTHSSPSELLIGVPRVTWLRSSSPAQWFPEVILAKSATADHLGSRGGEEGDEAPRGWSQPATLLPYRRHLPARLGVAQGDFDELWVVMRCARQHGDPQTGPHKSAQCFVLFALEGQLWNESRSLA